MNRLPRLGELEHKSRRERFLSAWAVARKLIGVLYRSIILWVLDAIKTEFKHIL